MGGGRGGADAAGAADMVGGAPGSRQWSAVNRNTATTAGSPESGTTLSSGGRTGERVPAKPNSVRYGRKSAPLFCAVEVCLFFFLFLTPNGGHTKKIRSPQSRKSKNVSYICFYTIIA